MNTDEIFNWGNFIMDRSLIRDLYNCGDNRIIEFSKQCVRLNKKEEEALRIYLDECMTQERTAEMLDVSTRTAQEILYSAADKLLSLPWIVPYAESIRKSKCQTTADSGR